MQKVVDVFKIMFYVIGIITFLVVINTNSKYSYKKPDIIVKEKTIVKEVPVNNTIIDLPINTIGILFVIGFSVFVLIGFLYTISTNKKDKKDAKDAISPLKIKKISKL